MEDLIIFRPQELLALARSGTSLVEYSPLADQAFLLIEHCMMNNAAELRELTDWLAYLPCPVIVIADDKVEDGLTQAADARVSELKKASAMLQTIRRCPTAATVLVQVLRITQRMPLEAALLVESLAYATLQGGAEYRAWLAENRVTQPFEPNDEGPAVIVERTGNSVSLELNRASNRNAMSVEMRDALDEALQQTLLDEDVQSLYISGRGKCFSVGGDLTEFGSVPDPAVGHIVRSLSVPGRLLARCAQKTVVTLHGACIGSGIEFPAFAGRIVATKNSHFQLPEVAMGLIPGAGGCISIARRMGRQNTAWLALSGKRIPAQQALQWGLVDALTD